MKLKNLNDLKLEIQLQAKNGIDFILAAAVIWLLISFLWTLEYTSYTLSIFTFMIGAILLPLAFVMSKILKTNWKVKDNPLHPLGLWLNFAQLIYFPFLVFILISDADFFIMTYAIITGAHLFPYAWFYDEMGYAVMAVLISLGAFMIGLYVEVERIWFVPLFTSMMLFVFAGWIILRFSRLRKKMLCKKA